VTSICVRNGYGKLPLSGDVLQGYIDCAQATSTSTAGCERKVEAYFEATGCGSGSDCDKVRCIHFPGETAIQWRTPFSLRDFAICLGGREAYRSQHIKLCLPDAAAIDGL
jgi:hypothetical protein